MRNKILDRYLGSASTVQEPGSGDVSTWRLEQIQNRMDAAGATSLVVDLIIADPPQKVSI